MQGTSESNTHTYACTNTHAGVWIRKIELFAVADIYQSLGELEDAWMGDEVEQWNKGGHLIFRLEHLNSAIMKSVPACLSTACFVCAFPAVCACTYTTVCVVPKQGMERWIGGVGGQGAEAITDYCY